MSDWLKILSACSNFCRYVSFNAKRLYKLFLNNIKSNNCVIVFAFCCMFLLLFYLLKQKIINYYFIIYVLKQLKFLTWNLWVDFVISFNVIFSVFGRIAFFWNNYKFSVSSVTESAPKVSVSKSKSNFVLGKSSTVKSLELFAPI